MFIIDRVPKKLENFFRKLLPHFEKRQRAHFCSLVLAFALGHGRRNISHMNLFLKDQDLRQRRQDFLVKSPWDGCEVLKTGAREILSSMHPREGELLELIIDSSHTEKRGKTMEGAHRYFDPVSKSYKFGHTFVNAILRFRGVCIPWEIRPWLPRSFCRSERGKELGLKFRTSNEIAAKIIRDLPEELAEFFQIRVLFDSGFLNKVVVEAAREKDVHFISSAKSNRAFFPVNYCGKRTVSSYGPGVLRYSGKIIHLPGYKGQARYRVASREGRMRGIGQVQVVFSERLSDRAFITLVTDDLSLTAREVVAAYRSRWLIEVELKTLKQHLGLGDYQTRRYEGFLHHLHLCLISYQLLTALGLSGLNKKELDDAAIESFPRLQDRLRSFVARDHLSRLRRSKNATRVLRKIKELLVAA